MSRKPTSSKATESGQYRPSLWEKITFAVLAVGIILTALFIITQRNEIPARNFALMRILLSAAMGVVGGVIPGFLHVSLTRFGALIRAGGGLALAVLTYFFTPSIVPPDTLRNEDAPKASAGLDSSPTPTDQAPLIRLDNVGGNALVHQGGERYRSGDVLRVFGPNGTEVGTAYPVISFDLAKPGRGVVKLDKTRVVWEPLDLRTAFMTSTLVDNFKPPLTFLASLHRNCTFRDFIPSTRHR